MSLRAIQRDFLAHVLRGDDVIVPRVSARGRPGLAVYAHAYRANLVACLKDTYEKTLAWLGDDAFEAAALAHIARHPPRSWTLAAYGQTFPRTLAGLYPADPEVEELAWLDGALRRAFDGPDAVVQDPATLGDVDWERAVLIYVRVTLTNVAALWTGITEAAPPPPARLDMPRALAVWRRDVSPMFRSLSPRESMALDLARAGAAFGEICAMLADHHTDPDAAAAEAGGFLAGWLGDQIVVGVAGAAHGAAHG
jgi:hypothetical protein